MLISGARRLAITYMQLTDVLVVHSPSHPLILYLLLK